MESWPVIVLLCLILGIVMFKVRTPKFIGRLGEYELNYKLKRLDATHYTSIPDLLLPTHGGYARMSQIDHLVISTYGIFCIETKNRSGTIVGTVSEKEWTQVLGNNTYTFYNPIRQNYGHLKALEGILGRRLKAPIVSLIAFPVAEHLEIAGTDSVSDAAGTVAKLLNYLVPVYSPEERRVLVQLVEANRIRDRSAYRKHVKHVKSHKA